MALGRFSLVVLGLFLSGIASLVVAQEPANELAEFYGFRPLEIFKLATRSGNMVAGDLNHDGLTDLAIVDNSNSRIDLLLQRKKMSDQKEKSTTKDVNSFKGDWRFEHKKFPVDKALSALSLGDFNGDGRLDMAYVGLPDRLIVKLQPETGEWKAGPTFRLPDLQLAQWMMAAGDLNHDGKDDLVILGKNYTFLLYQKEGEIQAPERLMNTSDKLGLIQIGDLDGDGRADLSYLANDDSGRSLCARFQTVAGKMGPELRF
ncbi:MAG: repeat protein, partial [Planctomycetaceae bacterium]|nr:repeat protein [Planctomycetaceae bacterium]